MKQKTSSAKRPSRPGAARHKRKPIARPLHKRLLLHPFSVMVLLCAGVILAGSTYRGFAASYDVTATVPAPLPASPAVITHPAAELHVQTPATTVTGTCPPQSYVKLYRNSEFSGVGQCQSQAHNFSIQTGLSPGTNQLHVRVFNTTDQEGPASTPVVVHYDFLDEARLPGPVVPDMLPTNLWVGWVDNRDSEGGNRTASTRPTVRGTAPPWSDIEVTFHSDPVVCKTKADAAGVWSCTLQTALPEGWHRVDIVAITPGGQRMASPSFQIKVEQSIAGLLQLPPANPPTIDTGYTYRAYRAGEAFNWDISIRQGRPPYRLQAGWGDGSNSGYVVRDHLPFSISHTYPKKADTRQYAIVVQATDADGVAAPAIQLSAVVKGTGAGAVAGGGVISDILSGVQKHLWIVWPAYIVVVLMVLSYWLGEQEVYRRFVKRRSLARQGGKGHGR